MKIKCLTINVRGLRQDNGFLKFCQSVSRWVRDGEVHAVAVQEHNLHPKAKGALTRVADYYGFHLPASLTPACCSRKQLSGSSKGSPKSSRKLYTEG